MEGVREGLISAILQYTRSDNESLSRVEHGILVIQCSVEYEDEILSILSERDFLEGFGFNYLGPNYPFDKRYLQDQAIIKVPMIPEVVESDPDSDIDLT